MRVADNVLEIAVKSIVAHSGAMITDDSSEASFCVTDRLDPLYEEGSQRILVVENKPFPAAIGRAGVQSGLASAVMSRDCVDSLRSVFAPLCNGYIMISRAVNDVANTLPCLTQRQHLMLSMISGGHTKDVVISRSVGVSVATVKRDLAAACEALDAQNRRDLIELARGLGYRPGVTRCETALLPG